MKGPGNSPSLADAFDWRQFRALLGVHLRELARSGTDPTTGAKGNPLVQIFVVMSIFGLLTASTLWVAPVDAVDFVHRIFASIWLIGTFAVIPDSLQLRETRRDILGSLPVSSRTHAVVQLTQLWMVAAILTSSFVIWPLAGLAVAGGIPFWQLPGLLVAAAAAIFSLATLWLVCALRIGQRFGMERVRGAAQLLTIATMLMVSLPTLVGYEMRIPREWATWLPPVWFADLGLGQPSAVQAFLAVGILGVAVMVAYRLNADVYYQVEKQRFEAAGSRGLAARWLDFCHALPWLGRRWMPREVHTLADLTLRVTGREEASRLRGIAAWAMATLGFTISLYETYSGFILTLVSLGSAVVDGVTAAGQSADAGASWVIRAVPVSAKHRLAAVRWVVLLRFASLPMFWMMVIGFVELPLASAAVLACCLPVLVSTMITVALALVPTSPLGSSPSLGITYGCLATQACLFPLGITLAILVGLASFGPIGLLIDLCLTGLGTLVGFAANTFAAHRLEQLDRTASAPF